MLLKFLTIAILLNFKSEFCYATPSEKIRTCPDGFKTVVVDGNTECLAQCQKPCVNGFCSAVDVCSCYSSFELDHNDKFKCVLKPTILPPITATATVSTTTTTIKVSSIKKERDVVIFGDVAVDTNGSNELITTTTTDYPITTTTDNPITSTTDNPITVTADLNLDVTTIFLIDQDVSGNYSKIENERIIDTTLECERNCSEINGECGTNGTCICKINWEYNNDKKLCVEKDNDENANDNYKNDLSKSEENDHDNFYIIGYVIIALIILLAILSAVIIYLLLRETGSNYNVSKYEKRFGSRYGNGNDTEMQEIPLKKGSDNNYYDADRFLDDRKFV